MQACVFDFDGTIAKTFTPSPSGIGVNEVTKMAVCRVFGMPGLAVFDLIGGLRNRAPIEIIGAMISQAPKLAWFARRTFDSLHFRSSEFIKSGAGVPLVWPDSDSDVEGVIAVATELFVRAKIAIYIPEIRMWPSGLWPIPCDGIVNCLKRIISRNVPWAILSSGHEFFIKETFNLWGAEYPKIMVTDDDLRGSLLRLKERSKPHKAVFDFLLDRWKRQDPRIAGIDTNQIVYVGDDPNKDGLLAQNTGTRFVWYNPNRTKFPNEGVVPDLEIRHYDELNELFP